MGNADFHTIFDEELWILVFLRLRLFCCTSFFFFLAVLKFFQAHLLLLLAVIFLHCCF